MNQTRLIQALEAPPARQGQAPRVTRVNPQKQLELLACDWPLIDELAAFAFALDRVVERPTRIAPPGSRALALNARNAHPYARAFMIDHEFAHIHNPLVGSLHVTLLRTSHACARGLLADAAHRRFTARSETSG